MTDFKLGFGIAVVFHFPPGCVGAPAKGLDIAVCLENVGDVWIAIIRDSGSAEVFRRYIAVRAAGTVNFYPVIEPVNPDRRVGAFVSAVQHGVVKNLLNSRWRVGVSI